MKLLVRIRESIEIVYITVVFISVLAGFVIARILARVTWVLAQEWAISILTAKIVTWALIREWVLVRDTTVLGHYGSGTHMYTASIIMHEHTCT